MTTVLLAVNGTLMRGLELNKNLIAAKARIVKEARAAACYRLWSIEDRHPAMQKVKRGGKAIDLEIWDVPSSGVANILEQEPSGLCIGKIELSDGEIVLGVLAEAMLCDGRKEITGFGGWRAYCAAKETSTVKGST